MAIAVLLLLVWAGSYAMDGPLTRYMERSVNQRLKGYTASLRRAHFNPFNLSVNLYEVGLLQDVHPDPPIARFPHVWADLEWSSLLHGRVVAKFEFIEPVLYVDRNHLEQEPKDPTPVKEHGWQEALEVVYPFKMNLFRVNNGAITYVERGGTRPLELKGLTIEARNIRNVRSPDREYPSSVRVENDVFDYGHAVVDGRADFTAVPHLTCKRRCEAGSHRARLLRSCPRALPRARPQGHPGGRRCRRIRPRFPDGPPQEPRGDGTRRRLRLSGRGAEAREGCGGATQRKGGRGVERPRYDVARRHPPRHGRRRHDQPQRQSGLPRVVSSLDLSVKNFSNHFSEGSATARLTGKFMGSGKTQVAATFRPEDKGPDFDLDVRIDDTDMTTMNDMLRAYGKFDVVQGLFSFYTQREVATKTTIHGDLRGASGTKVNTGEALVNLVRNAFFRAILPGFDAELRGGGRGGRGRQVRSGAARARRSASGRCRPTGEADKPVAGSNGSR